VVSSAHGVLVADPRIAVNGPVDGGPGNRAAGYQLPCHLARRAPLRQTGCYPRRVLPLVATSWVGCGSGAPSSRHAQHIGLARPTKDPLDRNDLGCKMCP
jgi:hypothetical protein